MPRLLAVAGASGALGRHVVATALDRGWRVRAITRDPARLTAPWRDRADVEVVVADGRDRAAVAAALAGVDALCSSAGASVAPAPGHGWRGYGAVDVPVNRALIDGARAAGVGRVVYVSVLHAPAMRRLAYVAAHERVVAHLRASGLAHAVLRPTGFFSALASYLDLARRGAIPEIGDGLARSNPIADEDLAEVVLDAVADADPALEVAAGGPEVLTRRELAEAAFAALGRPLRIRHVPAGPLPAALALARPFHPRLAQFMRFAVAISTQDLIAPPRGRCRLIDALTARVAGAAAGAHAPRRGA